MMTRSLLLTAALTLSCADAATKVAVIELGPTATVHHSNAGYPETSPAGVTSFFQALHRNGRRKLQQSDMAVVPDLFNKPESGVVLSISGADLETMPELNSMMQTEEKHMKCHGKKSKAILKQVDNVDTVEEFSALKESVETKAKQSGLSGVSLEVTDKEQAALVDAQVSGMIKDMKKKCHKSGDKVVLHLMIEDATEDAAVDENEFTRHRRLQEEDGDENNTFYGYSYYNAYGELITTSHSMFQIHYFNVVLWTALGLVLTLVYSFTLMIGMPLMPDTLLFGESAKVPLDD